MSARDRRLRYPAASRNRDPILVLLEETLPDRGDVLEVASGSGEHALHFARHLPAIRWIPTDPSPEARASIDSWRATRPLPNLQPARALDVTRQPWPVRRADAVVCINMIHIAPWRCTEALVEGAASLLSAGAPLVLYGPFRIDGAHTAPSNASFDASLKARDPAWGVRDLAEVAEVAGRWGFGPPRVVSMPANNHSVIFRRSTDPVHPSIRTS